MKTEHPNAEITALIQAVTANIQVSKQMETPKLEKIITASEICAWLSKNDRAWKLSHQSIFSTICNGNLSAVGRVVYLLLRSIGKTVNSTDEDLAQALSITPIEISDSLFELRDKGLIEIELKATCRVIIVNDSESSITCYSQACQYLNVNNVDMVVNLLERGTLVRNDANFLTSSIYRVKRYMMLKREAGRANLFKYFLKNELLD